jgi:outer membrane beta-barrel protein
MLNLYLALPALAEPPDTEVPPVEIQAVAQEDEDAPEDSVRAEKEAVRKEKPVEAKTEEGPRKKRLIKTIQRKNFMKIHRFEIGPSLGFVTNDPFLNRYIVGAVADYHLTEIFALEAQLNYAPALSNVEGDACNDPDAKPLTCQLVDKNSVAADISKLLLHGNAGLAFSPIYGKAAVGRRIIAFDIYGNFGLGFVQTDDDLEALQEPGEDEAVATEKEFHTTTVIGGGARVAFSESLASRFEVKSLTYIETVSSDTLEMKNNLIVQLSLSFFFPGMK